MKAIVRDRYGSIEALRLRDIPTPTVGDGDVLVRVRASSLNGADLDNLYGRPWFARAFTGLRRPRIRILGVDVAGEVEAVGQKVTRFKPGDEVFGDVSYLGGEGTFAEYVSAPERGFAPKPERLSFEEAATIPEAGIIALQALRGRWEMEPGHRVLINGASGGVGPLAIQLARHWGAEVTGTCRTEKVDFVRSVGADQVIDYTREDFTRSGKRYNLIVDVACRRSMFDLRRALAPGGRYVGVGGTSLRLLQMLMVGAAMSAAGSRKVGLMYWWKPMNPPDVAYLIERINGGTLRPYIDRSFPLEEAPDALRYYAGGHAKGKVVITA